MSEKPTKEMMTEWCTTPLLPLAIKVLVDHPLPWTAEKGYWPPLYYITASDGYEIAGGATKTEADSILAWAQALVDESEASSKKYRGPPTTNMKPRIDDD